MDEDTSKILMRVVKGLTGPFVRPIEGLNEALKRTDERKELE